ncbi:MAG: hypothetical protein NWR20_03410, partial [Schleiferiaceae bacterium]|nr:hypothetical protein [Schleiferiaceae bacterium]
MVMAAKFGLFVGFAKMQIGPLRQNLLGVEMAPTVVNFNVLCACKYLTPVALNQNSPLNSAVLVLAWPEVTARGEEGIMKFLRSIGLVKNVKVTPDLNGKMA